jgi:predicted PurR-regulated permease PerM
MQPTPEPSTARRLGQAIPFGFWVVGALAAIVVVTGMALSTITMALAPISSLIIAVTIALLLTALLQPVVTRLGRIGIKQSLGAALTLVLFLVILVGAFWLTGAQIATGAQDLVDGVSAALDDIQAWLKTEPFGISGDQISNWIEQGRNWLQTNWSSLAGGALRAGEALTSFTLILLLALVSTYFYLAQGRRMWLFFVRCAPTRGRRSSSRPWTPLASVWAPSSSGSRSSCRSRS